MISWAFMIVNIMAILLTLSTAFHFSLFLSLNQSGLLYSSLDNVSEMTVNKLAANICLLMLFVAIHSIMASTAVKNVIGWIRLSSVQRSLYNILSCVSLKLLMENWIVFVSDITMFWNLGNMRPFVYLCQICHLLGWLSVFSTVYILDFSEFIGTKQVLYHMNGLDCPLSLKTSRAKSFYASMRHPVATGLLVTLWLVPCMTLDRFLLSSVFTIYLFAGSQLATHNYHYIKEMYTRKTESIDNSF